MGFVKQLIGKFQTSELQYSFKPKYSATQCTFSMLEAVNHFQQNNTDVYVLLLDASKAFDKVNYVKLFHLLLERGVDPITVRCLLYMYTNQHVDVMWNNHRSSHFPTSNGVKQGGVLSRILFGLYIDELLYRLKQSGHRCMVGHLFCGALGYAGDVSILAPLCVLRQMSDKCSDYGLEYNLQFNPAKCKPLNFSQQRDRKFLF